MRLLALISEPALALLMIGCPAAVWFRKYGAAASQGDRAAHGQEGVIDPRKNLNRAGIVDGADQNGLGVVLCEVIASQGQGALSSAIESRAIAHWRDERSSAGIGNGAALNVRTVTNWIVAFGPTAAMLAVLFTTVMLNCNVPLPVASSKPRLVMLLLMPSVLRQCWR